MLKMYYRQFDRLSPIKEEDYDDGHLKIHGVLITDNDFEFINNNLNQDFYTGWLIECNDYSICHRLYKAFYKVNKNTNLGEIDYNHPYLIEEGISEESYIEDFTVNTWLDLCCKYNVIGIKE